MPDQNIPGRCQFVNGLACDQAGEYALTYQTASGGTYTEGICRPHLGQRADQIMRKDGLVRAVRLLVRPEPPAPLVEIQPVGLDALEAEAVGQ